MVQVVSVLANAIKRLLPLALQPFHAPSSLTPAQWVVYGVWCVYMMYAEGYKAFQCKFAPYVVQRAFSILNHSHTSSSHPSSSGGGDGVIHTITTIINVLLAGPYSMGLFNAPRKRMIVAWCVGVGVYALVRGVKYLPYPYRSIVDGGVVLGKFCVYVGHELLNDMCMWLYCLYYMVGMCYDSKYVCVYTMSCTSIHITT
ncbi:hypothetical protein EON63_16880 [archaeon]|nr:MAG: hypothetical protein EON63_16880 [archaeon]